MRFGKIKEYISKLNLDDNIFEDSDIITFSNQAYESTYNYIINNSKKYYVKRHSFGSINSKEISFKLPFDYHSQINILYKTTYSSQLYEIPCYDISTTADTNLLYCEIRDDQIYFYNCNNISEVFLNYYYTPELFPKVSDITEDKEIKLPLFAEEYFLWRLFRLMRISDGEIEKALNIEYGSSIEQLFIKLKADNKKTQKNYRKFKRYF